MTTEFEKYVAEQKLDTRNIFRVAGVRYATVYYALRGEPILAESADKIKQAVFRITGVPYAGSFVLLQSTEPMPVPPKRRWAMKEENEFPVIPLSFNDLQVIGSVLFPYSQFVRHMVKDRSKRAALLATIENILQRISIVLQLKEEKQPFILTEDELSVINNAFLVFNQNMKCLFSRSKDCAEIAETCEALRLYLLRNFSPQETITHKNDE
jgi:hypothetical protein